MVIVSGPNNCVSSTSRLAYGLEKGSVGFAK